MQIYLKNKLTNDITESRAESYFKISKNIRDLNDEATQEEADLFILNEAKKFKIEQIKANRDEAQLKPVTNPSLSTAPLLLGFGQGLAGEDVNFSFDTKPTGNGLTDPSTILSELIIEDSTTDYATERLDTNEDCYVRINKIIAKQIKDHLKVRVVSNIGHARDLVNQVESCTTIEEVNNIDITFS